MCDSVQPAGLLGFAQEIDVGNGQYVCNLFGQFKYGRDRFTYTDLGKLEAACQMVLKHADPDATFAMPYRIGCGLGGGDWGETIDMLTLIFANRELTLYKID